MKAKTTKQARPQDLKFSQADLDRLFGKLGQRKYSVLAAFDAAEKDDKEADNQ